MLTNLNNSPQGILFDLDGTLLDTANDLGAALNHVLNQHQLPTVHRSAYRPIASDGAKGLLELGFAEKIHQYNFDELRHQFLEYYRHNIAVNTILYSGVDRLISALDDNGIPWGIVTNKPETLTLALLPSFPELNQCKVIVGGDTLTKRKPDPEPLLFACEKLNLPPSQCLYVGDAPRDIEAGNAANMTTIIAKWGYIQNLEECQHWSADIHCEQPTDILNLLR